MTTAASSRGNARLRPLPALAIIGIVLGGLFAACAGEKPPAICLTASGFDVTVWNIWSGVSSHTVSVQGLSAFEETVSRDHEETHTLRWTAILNDYTTFSVTSFTVDIDGAVYTYPADKC